MTGLAIANPNTRQAEISFYFTDDNGKDFGLPELCSWQQTVRPRLFSTNRLSKGEHRFPKEHLPSRQMCRSAPVHFTGRLNERSEFLITTLPVIPLSAVTGSQVLPYFADGGGMDHSNSVVNPSDSPMNGTVQFFDPGSTSAAGAATNVSINGQTGTSFPYAIPARSSRRLGTSGEGSTTKTGSVRVVPSSGSSAPSVSNVFSYKPGAVTLSESRNHRRSTRPRIPHVRRSVWKIRAVCAWIDTVGHCVRQSICDRCFCTTGCNRSFPDHRLAPPMSPSRRTVKPQCSLIRFQDWEHCRKHFKVWCEYPALLPRSHWWACALVLMKEAIS